MKGETWWVMTESNRRHSACKADALPTELITRFAWCEVAIKPKNAWYGKCFWRIFVFYW